MYRSTIFFLCNVTFFLCLVIKAQTIGKIHLEISKKHKDASVNIPVTSNDDTVEIKLPINDVNSKVDITLKPKLNGNKDVSKVKNSSNELSPQEGIQNQDISFNLTGFRLNANIQDDVIESGALLRGFYVFAGLGVLILIWFLVRSIR